MSPRAPDEELDCSVEPTHQILFVLSLFTLAASWQAPELIQAVSDRRSGATLRQRMTLAGSSVLWNCTRILAPGYVAIMSMSWARSAKEWAALYYSGCEPDYAGGGAVPVLTARKWVRILLMDGLPLVLQPLLIVYSAALARQDARSPISAARWVIGCVPAASIGFCLLAASLTASPRA